jgi:hypothetical protein
MATPPPQQCHGIELFDLAPPLHEDQSPHNEALLSFDLALSNVHGDVSWDNFGWDALDPS